MYQKKFRFAFGTIGHKGGKVNFGGTDHIFREFSELMDDASNKMPEGTYLALYDKLKKLKDETNKNTDDNYYERGSLRFANDQWRIWQLKYEELNKETEELQISNNVLHNTGKNLEKELAESEKERDEYEHKNKELEDKIKELKYAHSLALHGLQDPRNNTTTTPTVKTNSSGPAPFFQGTGGRRLGR